MSSSSISDKGVIEWSPSGHYIAIYSTFKSRISLYTVQTITKFYISSTIDELEHYYFIKEETPKIHSISWSFDENIIAYTSKNEVKLFSLILYALNNNQYVPQIIDYNNNEPIQVMFMKNKLILAVSYSNYEIILYDIQSTVNSINPIKFMQFLNLSSQPVSMLLDSSYLTYIDTDNLLNIWNLSAISILHNVSLEKTKSSVIKNTWTPNNKNTAVCTYGERKECIINVKNNKSSSIKPHMIKISNKNKFKNIKNGNKLYLFSRNNNTNLKKININELLININKSLKGSILQLLVSIIKLSYIVYSYFSENENYIIILCLNNIYKIDIYNNIITKINQEGEIISLVKFHPINKNILCYVANNTIKFLNLQTLQRAEINPNKEFGRNFTNLQIISVTWNNLGTQIGCLYENSTLEIEDCPINILKTRNNFRLKSATNTAGVFRKPQTPADPLSGQALKGSAEVASSVLLQRTLGKSHVRRNG